MSSNLLEVSNLSIWYNGNQAIQDISFEVKDGDLFGIVGPNGAGKTTLFRAILGLQPFENGKIRLYRYNYGKFGSLLPLIGYVPQKISFETNFPATVFDVIEMGIIPESKISKAAKMIFESGSSWKRSFTKFSKNDEKVNEALRTVGLEKLKNRRIGELSGGELQRVFIAKSLVKDPFLLILDEPVTSVDVDSQTKFYNVIKKLNEENGITIIWSSHDLKALSRYANRVACMNKKLFFHGEKEKFFSDKELLKTYAESAMQMHMHHHELWE